MITDNLTRRNKMKRLIMLAILVTLITVSVSIQQASAYWVSSNNGLGTTFSYSTEGQSVISNTNSFGTTISY